MTPGGGQTLRIGVSVDLSTPAGADFAREAERLGAHSAWTAETWGYDALTPLAYLAAQTTTMRLGSGVAQVGTRTPAMLAMSAMSLQALSGGRFILGLGVSGPQVMEGWHGVRFSSPVARTRETIDIIKMITRGDRLVYDGSTYTLPLPDGAGRPIRSAAPPVDVPVWVAALGPRNLHMTGEVADGWMGQTVIPETASTFIDHISSGAAAAGRSLADLTLSAMVSVEIGHDVEAVAKRHARGYAFTIGAMGSADQNFYKDAFGRQGFEDAVDEVQALWRAGKREEAGDRVPVELAVRTNLLGTEPLIAERLRAYRAAGFTLLRAAIVGAGTTERLDALAALLDVVGRVNRET